MLSQGAFSRRVCSREGFGVECVAGMRGKCFGAEGGWRAGSGALAGDKHGLMSDSCRNQNIVSSCILMSWMLQRRSVHALIYSIYFVYSPCLFNNRDRAH